MSQQELFERDREMLMKNESIPVEEKQQALAVIRLADEDKDRMDMSIDTKKFNSKEGEIIPIDDVDDNLINQYYLSEQKRNLKRMLWEAKHGDWVRQQERKAKEREMNKKKTK